MVSQALRLALGVASALMLAAMKYRNCSSSFFAGELIRIQGDVFPDALQALLVTEHPLFGPVLLARSGGTVRMYFLHRMMFLKRFR
jgi:hypothetical protein